jgi:biotin carboxyl carrier protein
VTITKRPRLIGGVILILVVLGLLGFFLHNQTALADQDDKAAGSPKMPVSQSPSGDPVLHVSAATQARIGLRTQVLALQRIKPELTAYGKLEEDPSRSFVLRAPISGTLHYASGRDWPELGAHLADGAVIGTIEPRFTPSEQINLTSQLATALSEQSTSTAALKAARAAYQRALILNADNKNISDQALQEAAARLQAQEASLKAASETVRQIEHSLQVADPSGRRKLTIERGGEVVEVTAQPGEAIEPGSPILRVAKLNQLLARIDIPVGQHVPASVLEARIVPVGFDDHPINAKRIGVAVAAPTAPIQGQTQGEAFLFRLDSSRFGLRPGLAVTAYLGLAGPLQAGVSIPQAAVVRYQGSGYAFVQAASDQFVRKQVALDRFTQTGYFTDKNFQPGDRVVVVGAQTLLSEEFKSQAIDTD